MILTVCVSQVFIPFFFFFCTKEALSRKKIKNWQYNVNFWYVLSSVKATE